MCGLDPAEDVDDSNLLQRGHFREPTFESTDTSPYIVEP